MQVGDIGVPITVNLTEEDGAPHDMTGATNIVLYLLSPTGRRKQFSATVVPGATSSARYVTAASTDFDEPGRWWGQIGHTLNGYSGRSSKFKIDVGEAL